MKSIASKNKIVICSYKKFLPLKMNIVVGKKLCDKLSLESVCKSYLQPNASVYVLGCCAVYVCALSLRSGIYVFVHFISCICKLLCGSLRGSETILI